MKLTECRCTNCNAPLMIEEDAEFYTCEYCDEIIHRDLSAETPSEATGKMLAKKVGKYQEDLTKLEMYEKKCQSLNESILAERRKNADRERQQNTAQNSANGEISGAGFAIGLIICIAGIIVGISNMVNDKWGIGVIAITVALVIGLSMTAITGNDNTNKDIQSRAQNNNDSEFSALNYGNNRTNNTSPRLDSLKKQLKMTEEKLESHKNSFDVDFIPAKYRSQDALTYLKDALECGRAYSMKEAYNLYENHLDKVKLQQMQQQSLDLQQKNIEAQNKLIQQNNQAKTVDTIDTIASTAATVVGVAKVVSILDDLFGD